MPNVRLARQQWHYETWGSPSRPAVVLLHGFTGTSHSWTLLAEKLGRHYFCIAPDLPGHGLTAIPDDPQQLAMDPTADRIVLLLDYLSMKKVTVIGYSMGGRLALHVALRYRELSGLILESASPGLATEAERQARRKSDEKLANEIEMRGLAWFLSYWNAVPLFKTQTMALQEEENHIRRRQSTRGLAQSLRGAGTGAQASLWEDLSHIEVPSLLISGGLDEKFSTLAQAMATRLPHSTWVEVAGAGHTVHGEMPEKLFEMIVRFLENLHREEDATNIRRS